MTSDAKAFVRRYGLQASKRCNLLRYGDDTASILALGWAHKMQYYLDLHRLSLDEGYEFTQADHNDYQESAEFSRVAESEDPRIRKVVASIRKVRPTRPVAA